MALRCRLFVLVAWISSAACFHVVPSTGGTLGRGRDSRSAQPLTFRPPFSCQLNAAAEGRPISSDNTILVLGGTGGVGQLVTKKLRGRGYNVRVSARDQGRAKATLEDDTVDVVELDLLDTTPDTLDKAMDGVAGVVIAVGTTAFPTKKWAGGNNPVAIDEEAVTRVAQAAAKAEGMKRVVLLTSIGVDRTKEMPFLILNLFGVLDAKRSGEEAVMAAAAEGGFDYAIVRPGRLVGGPYTNPDLAKLMQIEGGAENGVTVETGDTLQGNCKRDACAEAVVQCLENAACKNIAFSIVSSEEKALTNEQWTAEFTRMRAVPAEA